MTVESSLDFSSRAGARDHLASHLAAKGVEPALAVQIAAECVDEFYVEPDPRFRAKLGRWVIRNDDLNLTDTLLPTLVTLATTAADTKSTPAVVTGIASSVSAAFLVARRLVRFSIRLTPLQAHALSQLKRTGGSASSASLAERANGYPGLATDEEVEQAMQSLTTLRLTSGSVRGIVEKSPDGTWHVIDV